MNDFIKSLNGVNDIDTISIKYRVFEKELKEFIEIGKEFSDEIYRI
ncbi:MAG: hypothetical protein H7195_07265 [Chryseobacterium sp.]|nr:hypothetical protein [Chryseobacterium sp.]